MLYKETQRFTQWWLWILLGGMAFIPITGIVQQIILGKPFGDHPMSDAGLLLFAAFIFLLVYGFYSLRLVTEIDDTGIRVNFSPLGRFSAKWEDIESVEMVDYGFVGGWGIRYSGKYGTVYNIRGRVGLAIKKKDGGLFVVGTQKKEELEKALKGKL